MLIGQKGIGIIAPKRKETAIICFVLYSERKGIKDFWNKVILGGYLNYIKLLSTGLDFQME